MNNQKFDPIGYALIAFLVILLGYAGYISYKSIDYQILNKLESEKLVLPTPLPASTNTPSVSPGDNVSPSGTK